MFPSHILVLLISAIAGVTIAAPMNTTIPASPIPGYTIVDMQWDIEISPGRYELLIGTVQEVVAQATQLDPTFTGRFDANIAAAITAQEAETALVQGNSVVKCGFYERAAVGRVQEGIKYLRGIGGRPYMQRGPKVCSRVSCSHHAAIHMCNDRNYARNLVTWNQVADSVQHILNTCPATLTWNDGAYVSGQNFESRDWNTIVSNAKC